MTILFALAAAFCNALNLVMQHIASTGDPGRSKGWRFVRYLVSNPLWLLGWIALAGAFVFQALALHNGQMSVVQPLLVTELVFGLVLRRLWIHQQIRGVTWWAAALTCGSLALFVAVSEPTGGDAVPTSSAWVAATAVTAGAAGLLALFGSRGSPVRRAASLGRRDVHPLGARGHLHQGDHRHADPVRAARDVHPLARVRTGGGRPRGGAA